MFQAAITRQFENDEWLEERARAGSRRNFTAMLTYAVAIPAAYLHPGFSFALICGVSVMYFLP